MRSAVLEPDEAGTFVGSTFMYASARDWARLGLLFLHDGQWQGQRLLPEGWVAYSLTPTTSPGLEQWPTAGYHSGISHRLGSRKFAGNRINVFTWWPCGR